MSNLLEKPAEADVLASLDRSILSLERRLQAFEYFSRTRSGRERPGRYWRIDLETLAPDPAAVDCDAVPSIDNPNANVVACDLQTAASEHVERFARAFGATGAGKTKFGALTTAFAGAGAFVYVPAETQASEPITIEYDFPAGASSFPYTVVLAEAGSEVTVIERYRGAPQFVSGVAEIVTGENARVTFASHQALGGSTQCFQTRLCLPGKDATVDWMAADIGAALSVNELAVAIEQTGITAGVTAVFFPNGKQHVDVLSRIEHSAGNSVSNTIVKSAAIDSGQARYVGNIMIAEHAQGSNAALRDDALLLSKQAHIDSVPALEIAANDVKAYHGATVGALDPDQIFYMQSRGIAAAAAERMIAIAFFEPAIERFPTRSLRDEIRAAIEGKLTAR
ncbi:MAG TPA: Fe-S cluster assembly protein SufD [Candidatus Acidoferrum sp.]|nr:Fe-S cluster assembly protein SufD [Candidatus Acidoferrum sp.]